MQKRYLDCSASEILQLSKKKLLEAIKGSEGRLLVSETIGTIQPVLMTVTNAELAASQGADILLLNVFDVNNPIVLGLPEGTAPETMIKTLKHLTGRAIGVNLEPVPTGFNNPTQDAQWKISEGRLATVKNAMKLKEMGVDIIVLTGNPGNGVTNQEINQSLKELKAVVGNDVILITGKMHAAGVLNESAEQLITEDDIRSFISSGADIILLPAPGTVPGITLEFVQKMVAYCHSQGVMTMTAIGTSQEGADIQTIRQIALMCKMAGTDLHHIGDSGYNGIALPENILNYGIVIRGVRHTYSRIARSVNR
ncbi:DUF7916 family protein [Providencia heimbachae]|uniref:Dihydrodipicolinate synthase n=1 Tax=Providencia heimbachae ATCC 35613 TaxID=1354272 RepID=A0A1B7JNT5_9GAMM|nr:PEP phosphonomutase [Providencia heimbachae]OAT49577.1 dihydrodipicolinate synthase [Providencia heimbachae ATCC 35613]QCJ69236.1 PEP phosphonomutase [Providencia heimbachae]SQH12300.1 Uncharacterised protein [Providencia heimbachae]